MRRMNHSAVTPLRGAGKAFLAGLLVLLLFFSALASGSSVLHGWLHSDHQSPSHYCLVTLLDHGHGHAAPAAMADLPVKPLLFSAVLIEHGFYFTADSTLHSGRGPPVLS